MYEMSLYSTPIWCSAFVAGPLKNGEVVASWRNTSKNSFSSGVRIVIVTAPVSLLARWHPGIARVALATRSHDAPIIATQPGREKGKGRRPGARSATPRCGQAEHSAAEPQL